MRVAYFRARLLGTEARPRRKFSKFVRARISWNRRKQSSSDGTGRKYCSENYTFFTMFYAELDCSRIVCVCNKITIKIVNLTIYIVYDIEIFE